MEAHFTLSPPRVMEDANMANPARSMPELPESSGARNSPLPPNLPVLVNARDFTLPAAHPAIPNEHALRFIDATALPAKSQPNALGRKKKESGSAVLRGIKDLQQLQKQTIAVLESVKGALDDIQQVLRSPEATRGMEKQQNAAMLLSKGFARDAVEQALGATSLLPANPETHLLLSLSLAADQQFDASLATARKGLALFDRRQHPLAIEAGLLHALASLGCSAEAVDRWTAIIDALPLPILFEHMARIAACFPPDGRGEGSQDGATLLDELLNRRLARDDQNTLPHDPAANRAHLRQLEAEGKIDLRPDQFPAPTLFAGLEAAHDHQHPSTHRAILAQIARRLQLIQVIPGRDTAAATGEVIKFLGECVVPLANRGLDRSVDALSRAAVKRLLRFHADAMTLHRAMGKLELAGATFAQQEIASLLNHWRNAGRKVARAHHSLSASAFMLFGGAGVMAYVLWIMNGGGALHGKSTLLTLLSHRVDALWFGPALMALGGLVGIIALFGRTWHVALPDGRPPLSSEERAYLKTAALRQSLRAALQAR